MSNVLAFGLQGKSLDSGRFLGRTNLHEYSSILLMASSVQTELNDGAVASFQAVSLRMQQLDQWVQEGNRLVILGVGPLLLRATGFFLRLPPLDKIGFEPAEGKRLEACGPPQSQEFLASWRERLTYNYVISGENLRPLLRVQKAQKEGPSQIVAAAQPIGRGMVLYLPNFRGPIPVDQILELCGTLAGSNRKELPRWVAEIHSEPELEAQGKIAKLKSQMALLEQDALRDKKYWTITLT